MSIPADEGSDGTAVDPVEVSDDLLQDERGLVVRGSGVVVSHAVSTVADTPVRFQLVDPLPSKFDVEEIDFHPDYEPPHGRIDVHAAVVSGVVEPGRELVVRYGLRPTRQRRPPAVAELQRAARPSIELSEPVDPDEADDVDLDVASMSRGESDVEAADAATEGFYFGIKRLVFGADGEESVSTATSTGGNPSRGRDDRPAPGSAADADEESDAGGKTDAEPGQTTEGWIPGGDPFGGTNEDASLAASISEIETSVGRSDPDEADEATADADEEARPFREFFEVRKKDEPTEAADTTHAGTGEPGAAPDGDIAARRDADVAGELLHQLEAGEVTDGQRQALGEALADVLATAERPSKSTEVRLRELESKLEEFAVYTNALRDLIDVHGPADEFLDTVRGDIEALNEAVDDVRGDVAAAAKSRSGLDGRLEAAVDEVALLDARVERLRDRVDDLEVTHESEVGALETEVETLGAELDRLDELEADIGTLRQAVEDGQTRRRAVVAALREDESPGE